MIDTVEVRGGAYHDSVTLLRISQSAAQVPGVDAALVAMATDLNLGLLDDLDFDPAQAAGAGPNDLLIAVRAADEAALAKASETIEQALSAVAAAPTAGFGQPPPPSTLDAAARRAASRVALISVPGPYAFVEAMDALRAGLHVMVFSDNVSLDHEVMLKAEGRRRGLLVMGPDCGTAMVGGLGLGFSNAVGPGPVGIVAASGTGTQQVCCLLDEVGVGISHALGVGSRDLSAEVGAASTLAALDALEHDPATAVILVLSKPPGEGVATKVRDAVEALRTPAVFGFLGRGLPDLTAVTGDVLEALGAEGREAPRWDIGPLHDGGSYREIRGLFAGGTLCAEAMAIAADTVGPVASNIPLDPEWLVGEDLRADGHVMIDFGDDRLTRGRPHPMIDNTLRLERLREDAAREDVVILMDVILGYGAHPDPAAELTSPITEAVGRGTAVIVSLCGSRGDPQGRDRQATTLAEAGASVHLSNADAARQAVELVGS